jgi:hypothetical protein
MVRNLGTILKQTSNDDERLYASMYMKSFPPVWIYPMAIKANGDTPIFTIALYSDIWFPMVKGFIVDEDMNYDKSFDNRELANKHTTRFNQFLADTYKLVKQLNGTWEVSVGDGLGYFYEKYITETGIKLTLEEE